MSTKIDPNLMYSSLQSKVREGGNNILGKDDFLKILMTQLQNQDPLNPMEDKDFIAQMATFSSLEQMTNLTKTMESFVESNSQSQMIAYNQFVGKQVTWHKIEESEDPENSPEIIEGQGVIKGVRFNGNSVEFIMDDGTILTPANISQVNAHTNENSSLVAASLLIGKKVTWGAEGQEKSNIVKSISRKDGSIWVHFEDGNKVEAEELTKIES
ncbi:flagellar basal-body rod modification protein FlgD [Bacillus pakistanensis]|uniref:Basal-body rod modification protein FlgD n=1 Tax=Rossellomorea pakistanensis TaxID=992288 RepID=A0ABS2NG66_9BACI|nr:flagellar hook assembly protein FlgD [Bacillus pakistanensis]MBM7586836.1 flagellar basal-body rod modification protein FlgD [Bacillus pakistanensis]